MTLHHKMSRYEPSLRLQYLRNLLQGCENVDFEILVVAA